MRKVNNTTPGLMSATTDTIAGNKRFENNIAIGYLSNPAHFTANNLNVATNAQVGFTTGTIRDGNLAVATGIISGSNTNASTFRLKLTQPQAGSAGKRQILVQCDEANNLG